MDAHTNPFALHHHEAWCVVAPCIEALVNRAKASKRWLFTQRPITTTHQKLARAAHKRALQADADALCAALVPYAPAEWTTNRWALTVMSTLETASWTHTHAKQRLSFRDPVRLSQSALEVWAASIISAKLMLTSDALTGPLQTYALCEHSHTYAGMFFDHPIIAHSPQHALSQALFSGSLLPNITMQSTEGGSYQSTVDSIAQIDEQILTSTHPDLIARLNNHPVVERLITANPDLFTTRFFTRKTPKLERGQPIEGWRQSIANTCASIRHLLALADTTSLPGSDAPMTPWTLPPKPPGTPPDPVVHAWSAQSAALVFALDDMGMDKSHMPSLDDLMALVQSAS